MIVGLYMFRANTFPGGVNACLIKGYCIVLPLSLQWPSLKLCSCLFLVLMLFGWTNQECNIEEVSDEEETSSKSSKDKKANGPSSDKGTNLVFKITSRVPYKTVLKGISFIFGLAFSTLYLVFKTPSQHHPFLFFSHSTQCCCLKSWECCWQDWVDKQAEKCHSV